jgi:biotin synthase-related radical SAM superfamily protein
MQLNCHTVSVMLWAKASKTGLTLKAFTPEKKKILHSVSMRLVEPYRNAEMPLLTIKTQLQFTILLTALAY